MRRSVTLRACAPIGALVSSFTRNPLLTAPALSPQDGDIVLDTLCRLLALGIARDQLGREHRQDAVRAARLVRLKRLVMSRLTDPDLSAASLATTLRVSPRNIHLMFEGSGETFSEFVTARRLEACRASLSDPNHAARSVADIAFEWGFGNVSTFYRAFRAAFDMAPSETRMYIGL